MYLQCINIICNYNIQYEQKYSLASNQMQILWKVGDKKEGFKN